MPQICDMGQTALLPLRRKACCGFFFPPEKSDGFGRIRTRDHKNVVERKKYTFTSRPYTYTIQRRQPVYGAVSVTGFNVHFLALANVIQWGEWQMFMYTYWKPFSNTFTKYHYLYRVHIAYLCTYVCMYVFICLLWSVKSVAQNMSRQAIRWQENEVQ
jgi:hypothetical protein